MIELNDDNNNNSAPQDGIDFNVSQKTGGDTGLDESIIKVIGVGGGGGNAVNHMYKQGIQNVNFAVCNTDSKALSDSPVPYRLQLGEGLGAGNNPKVARSAAENDIDKIRKMLNDGTQMVFITAGMGGGTGTGAAPIVAREAKNMGILTVGIVTIPFRFEGVEKIDQALDGVEELAQHVDALLVINNERLRQIYPDLSMYDAFAKADDTLNVAAKGIADIITSHGRIGVDFNDVKMVLKDGGVAIMSTGYGEGENRLNMALQSALNSPLLNNNDIFNSQRFLFFITSDQSSDAGKLMMTEMEEINDFMKKFKHDKLKTKWGVGHDPELGKRVKITLLATGFGVDDIPVIYEKHERERAEQAERDARTEAEKEERMSKYYSSGDSGTQTKRQFQIYTFQNEDLDNADIISAVEASPTYKRSREQKQSIAQKSVVPVAAPQSAAKSEIDDKGSISFL